MKTSRPRDAAVDVLIRAEQTGRFVDDVLAASVDRIAERRDRALVTELVHGTSRARGSLDFILSRYRPLRDLRPAMRWILRVAIYQLGFTNRLAERVAVSAAVDQARAQFGRGGAGLANALLRSVQREWQRAPSDADEDATRDIPTDGGSYRGPTDTFRAGADVDTLAARYSYPAWLLARWLEAHDADVVRDIARAQNRRPDVHCRAVGADVPAVVAALAADGIEGVAEDGGIRVVSGMDRLDRSAAFRQGRLLVQDPTQAGVVPFLNVRIGDRVLELGAAPGTKTVGLARCAGATGFVCAMDRSPRRIRSVRENLDRCVEPDRPDAARVSLVAGDATTGLLDLAGAPFDRALVDAPCSNTGVLARRSDARWRLEPGDLGTLTGLQSGLLRAAIAHTRPGGAVVYSTCSIERDENERVVERVIASPDLAGRAVCVAAETTLPGPKRDGGFRARLEIRD